MTKEEFIAQRFASKLKVAKQAMRIDQIERQHEAQLEELLAAPKLKAQQLEAADESEHADLMPLVDFIPYKPRDFVCYGVNYYEVNRVVINFATLYGLYIDVSPAALISPPDNFMAVKLECLAIRKSGTLARWHTTLDANNTDLRKADLSEHVCLRRALKQRMRRRLEGGD